MFGSNNNSSRFAKNLADYRSENHNLIAKFRKIHEYLKRFKKFENLEKKDIKGNSFFNSNPHINEFIDSLDVNIDRTIEVVGKIIDNLDEEKKDIDKYYNKLSHTTIENIRELERILINYNKVQYDLMQELNSHLPNIIELTERVIGMEEVTFEKAAGEFVNVYTKLEKSLVGKSEKYSMYPLIEWLIVELKKYHGGFEESFLGNLKSYANAHRFADNYFSFGSDYYNKLNGWMKKVERDKDSQNSYSKIDKDDSEKMDKFFKGMLEQLFTGITITFESNDKTPKDLIAEIIKIESDFKELKEIFMNRYNALKEGKFANEKRADDKKEEDLVFICDGLDSLISFKEFKKDKLKLGNEDLIKSANLYLKTLIESKDNKNPYLEFRNKNISQGILLSKTGSNDDDDEKASKSEYDEYEHLQLNVLAVLDRWNSIEDYNLDENDENVLNNYLTFFDDIKYEGSAPKSVKFLKIINLKSKNLKDTKSKYVSNLLNIINTILNDKNRYYEKDLWNNIVIAIKNIFD